MASTDSTWTTVRDAVADYERAGFREYRSTGASVELAHEEREEYVKVWEGERGTIWVERVGRDGFPARF